MKKLVFVGITLFGISICTGELWGAAAIRSSKKLSKSSPNLQSKSSLNLQSKTSRSVRNSSETKKISKNQKSTAKNYTSKNSGNLKSVSNSASKKSTTKGATAKNGRVSQNSVSSFLKLEDNVGYILKDIIGNIPSSDIRVLISNMDVLSRSLPRKNRDEDIKIVVEKMNEATVCFDELLHIKSNLYAELFNQKEARSSFSGNVDVDRIVESLNRVDTNKLGEITALCVQKKLSPQVISNLEAFSGKNKEAKKILEEMKEEFSPVMLSRIEGLPELKNLEATDTAENRRLANSREESEANKISDAEDNLDDDFEDDNYFLNDISQEDLEENFDEDILYVPQKKPEKRPERKPGYAKTDEIDENSGEDGKDEDDNISEVQSSTVDSEGKNNVATAVADLNGTEDSEEFFRLLEINIGLLSERDFTNKQMTALKKIKGYLNDAKSVRSFEQKISDVNRIVKAYNSLVALNPKTKYGKSLPSVPRSKIRSLLEKIYLEVFDDLSARLKKLQSEKNPNKLNIRENFKKVLADNERNKKKFEQSDSGREKRDLMIKSVEAYDKLMENIWKYPNLIKTKKDREEFDRIGYTLDPVILSIDINPSR